MAFEIWFKVNKREEFLGDCSRRGKDEEVRLKAVGVEEVSEWTSCSTLCWYEHLWAGKEAFAIQDPTWSLYAPRELKKGSHSLYKLGVVQGTQDNHGKFVIYPTPVWTVCSHPWRTRLNASSVGLLECILGLTWHATGCDPKYRYRQDPREHSGCWVSSHCRLPQLLSPTFSQNCGSLQLRCCVL